MIIKKGRNNIQLEGCICEQFTYPKNLTVYPDSSYMNELGDISLGGCKKEVKI